MIERLDYVITAVSGRHLAPLNASEMPHARDRPLQTMKPQRSGVESVLVAIIESARDDPAQLRRLVYEVARANLEKQASQSVRPLTPGEIIEGTRALEAAIACVEASVTPEKQPETWLRQIHGPVIGDAPVAALGPPERNWRPGERRYLTSRTAAPSGARHRARPQRRLWPWLVVSPLIPLVG